MIRSQSSSVIEIRAVRNLVSSFSPTDKACSAAPWKADGRGDGELGRVVVFV